MKSFGVLLVAFIEVVILFMFFAAAASFANTEQWGEFFFTMGVALTYGMFVYHTNQ